MRRGTLIWLLLSACVVEERRVETVKADDVAQWAASAPLLANVPAPEDAELCKPPHLIAGADFTYEVSGLAEGERVVFYRGNGEDGERCFSFAGGACLDLSLSRYVGVRIANDEGTATLTKRLPLFVEAGRRVSMQSLVLRGADSFTTEVTHHSVTRLGEEGPGACGDVDVCGEPDMDGDGVTDACDPCPTDPLDDADGDGVCGADLCADAPGDADGDGVCDALDMCAGGDDALDEDGDGVCDALDTCPGADDDIDADGDGVCDLLDTCPGGDDTFDDDGDGVCDLFDTCPGGDDALDADGDGVCDLMDACAGGDDFSDADEDGVCDALDVCGDADDAVDADGDGVPDACDSCPADALDDSDGDGVCDSDDACPGHNDLADADGDGQPDACDWAGGDTSTPEYYPWSPELPPVIYPGDCREADVADITDGAWVAVGVWDRTQDFGTIVADSSGWYDIYDEYIAESGNRQLNEHSYLRIENDTNPLGFPYRTNCGDEWIIEDNDNVRRPSGATLAGTFWLDEGPNTIRMIHWCELYEAGQCTSFLDPTRGHGCSDDKAQSTHLEGYGLCVVRVD
jgi:hypothetical protein